MVRPLHQTVKSLFDSGEKDFVNELLREALSFCIPDLGGVLTTGLDMKEWKSLPGAEKTKCSLLNSRFMDEVEELIRIGILKRSIRILQS